MEILVPEVSMSPPSIASVDHRVQDMEPPFPIRLRPLHGRISVGANRCNLRLSPLATGHFCYATKEG